MPSNILSADAFFPASGAGTTEEQLNTLRNYLFLLLEQLRYTLNNLDTSNVNGAELSRFVSSVTEPVYARIEDSEGSIASLALTAAGLTSRLNDAEGNLSTLTQTANRINWLVASGTSASNFTMTDRAISLIADNIQLDGYVTFTDLSTSGRTSISGDNIVTGTINAIDVKGCRYYSADGTGYLSVGGDKNYGDLDIFGSAGNTPVFSVYDEVGSTSLKVLNRTFLTASGESATLLAPLNFSGEGAYQFMNTGNVRIKPTGNVYIYPSADAVIYPDGRAGIDAKGQVYFRSGERIRLESGTSIQLVPGSGGLLIGSELGGTSLPATDLARGRLFFKTTSGSGWTAATPYIYL